MNLILIIHPLQWFAGILLASLATFAYQSREQKLIRDLYYFFLLSSVWAVCSAIINESSSIDFKILFHRIKLISAVFLPVVILNISKNFSSNRIKISQFIKFAISIPILFSFIILSPWHEVMTYNYQTKEMMGVFEVLTFKDGPLFLIHNFIARTFVLISLVIIVLSMFNSSENHKKASLYLIFSILFPFVVDSVAVHFWSDLRFIQIVPMALTISSLVLIYAFVKYKIHTLTPIARSAIVSELKEPCLIWDNKGALIDYNKAANKYFNLNNVDENNHDDFKRNGMTVKLGESIFEISYNEIKDEKGRNLGTFSVFKDQTEITKNLSVKTTLMSILSHDIHEVIAQQLYLSQIQTESNKMLLEEQRRQLSENIFILTFELNLFMNNTLKWARDQFDGWKINVQPCYLYQSCEGIRNFLLPVSRAKSISIHNHIDPALFIHSDPVVFGIIFRNILYNSIKHSQKNDTVQVESRGDRLFIINQGTLVNIDEINNFLDGTNANPPVGLGLGLRLSRDFSTLIGLTIKYEQNKSEVRCSISWKT